jgi:hypothetical protein
MYAGDRTLEGREEAASGTSLARLAWVGGEVGLEVLVEVGALV